MNQNDLSYWFGPLRDSGVRVPETAIVRTSVRFDELTDGIEPAGFGDFIEEFGQVIASLPGPPYFIRSGHTSYKFGWNRSCYLMDISDLKRNVYNIVEYSCMADILGLPVDTWVGREFIRTHPRFRAFDGMPINR